MARSRIVKYGVNGDPLHEGKLDLPELVEVPTPADVSQALRFIHSRRWREAVTYRNTAPHEYAVRAWASGDLANAEFDAFVKSIRRFGNADLYYKIRHIYWSVNGFKYWTMGWPVEQTTVINRAVIGAPEPWKNSM
jgi:hypothetical protein